MAKEEGSIEGAATIAVTVVSNTKHPNAPMLVCHGSSRGELFTRVSQVSLDLEYDPNTTAFARHYTAD